METVNTKTEWGFETATDANQRKLEQAGQVIGELVAMGPQAWKAFSKDFTGEPWANIGDQVVFARYSGKHLDDPETGKEYLIMNDEDIRAIITGDRI